jgi:hypothetical protein
MRQRRVSGKDPDKTVSFSGRKRPDRTIRESFSRVQAGDVHAFPGCIEGPAVVRALYVPIDDLAVTDPDKTVGTPVFQGTNVALRIPEKSDRHVPDLAADRAPS